MTTDPIQALIEAGAIPSSPFGPESRYRTTGLAIYQPDPERPGTAYVLRRFIPQQRDIPVTYLHLVRALDRPDTLAAQAYGNAELYWRIADANAVTDPFELTDTLGARVAIPTAPDS
jgi:nucleoid-associated protein YgaU